MSSSAAEKEQALLKKRLEAQLKLPHNLTCADCPSRRASPRFLAVATRGASHARRAQFRAGPAPTWACSFAPTARCARRRLTRALQRGAYARVASQGIHRGLGVHISKVRSCALDKWTAELVSTMENIGNKRANEHWERDVPASVVRPREGDMRCATSAGHRPRACGR
jgi:hypothetical protein